MKITLENFETTINPVIVRRGKEYFCDNALTSLEQIKTGEWSASVEGSEIYKVQVLLKDADVISCLCSCPYDLGPVCKHVVAVLLAIREKLKKGDPHYQNAKPIAKKASGTQSAEETFEEVIKRIPRKNLNAVLLDYAGRESNFINHIFAHRVLKDSTSDKDRYRQVIRNTVNAARGKHGYIGYWETSRAVDGPWMVLGRAQELMNKKQPGKALLIFQCVLEEMIPLVQEADDSNGCIGDVIEQSFQGLHECARQAKDAAFRKKLFAYLFKEANHSRYEGWDDWRWDLLAVAGDAVKTPEEKNRLFDKIDEIKRTHRQDNDWLLHCDAQRAAVIKMAVIERLGTDKDVDMFLNQYLDYAPLRERAFERALKHKDFTQAEKLMLDGIKQDKTRGWPGLVAKWKQRLLELAHLQRNQADIKKYALSLFLDSGDFKYYKDYKKCFASQEWSQEAQKIVDLVQQFEDNRNKVFLLPHIYIQEERWQGLLDYVKENASAGGLENFAKHLEARFPTELTEIYEKVITEQLAPSLGRGNYQYLCRFLRRMKKLGAEERVEKIIEKLSAKYKNRPALLEELRRV